ncbi:MAG: chloride channel protein [Ardenticatenaceae bacterium]|nr:chloride channel protein [Ardenticatenaceae bacterium]MCB8948468.1 chloride channel protein [Ardenticatenaceae bacterium]
MANGRNHPTTDLLWRIGHKLRQHIDQVQPPDSLVMVLIALIVGVGTGLGAVVFVWLLRQISQFTKQLQLWTGDVLGLVLAMGVGGLIVGFIVNQWAKEAKGHGVPEVMEALALRGGRIRPRVASIKVLASSLTIGTGGSAGREGPIVQVGSALGSTIAQLLHFSADRTRTLVACGSAAGIAATFNAPIAGAIFALEVILGKFTVSYFGAVVISSVAASVIGRAFLSDRPAFTVPAYPFQFQELPIYVVLGVLAALVAVLFIRLLYFMEDRFDEWRLHPAFKASVGMLLTLGVALLLPEREALGPGLEFIGEAIAEDFSLSLGLMGGLLITKLLATCFTLGSGNSGGVFAPGLFMGAIVGGMVGTVAHSIWPEIAVNPGAYAIVGMAAVFSGAARAPITAVLIVFEMSNDYKLILPLMLATVLATLLAEHLFPESIYTLKLRLKGISLQRGRDLDVMQSLQVKEAMTIDPYLVQANMPLPQLGELLQRTHHHSFPVVDEDLNLVGMVSLRDYERVANRENSADLHVQDIATVGRLLTAFEDEPLSEIVQRLAIRGINKLPVVSREEPRRVVGTIRRSDIVKAYNVALARRRQDKSEPDVEKLPVQSNQQMCFMDIEITPESPAAQQTLAAVAPKLPYECVVVSVRRQGAMLVPHGNTILQPDDVLSVFVRRSDEEQLRRCFSAVSPKHA